MARKTPFLLTILLCISTVLLLGLLMEGHATAQACRQLGANCDFHSHPIDHSGSAGTRSNGNTNNRQYP